MINMKQFLADSMNIAEFFSHCTKAECSSTDLGPLGHCCLCLESFCGEHLAPCNHKCSSLAQTLLATNQVSDHSALLHLRTYTCSSEGCTECGPMKLECCMCGKHYCNNHRLHGCVDPFKTQLLVKRKKCEANMQQFEAAKELVDKMVEAAIKKHQDHSGSKLSTANKLHLMRLKQRATGSQTIPLSNRAYFLVHWKPSNSDGFDKKAVFVDRNWAMRHVIDVLAEQCDVFTTRHYSNFDDLRLFHMDGRLLTKDLSSLLEGLFFQNVLSDGHSVLIDKI